MAQYSHKPVRQPVNHTLCKLSFHVKDVSAQFGSVFVQLSGETAVTWATVNRVKPKPDRPHQQKVTLQDQSPV